MFGISLPEIILILVVVIIFVRPEDLPKFLRSAGRFYGKAKRMYKEIIGITNQVVKEMNSIASMDDPPASGTAKKNTPQKPSADPPANVPADLPAKDPTALLSAPGDLLNAPADLMIAKEPDSLMQAGEQEGNPAPQPALLAESESVNDDLPR